MGTSLTAQGLSLHLPRIGSLIGELRSHKPWSQKTKQGMEQYCNKFNKDF